MTTAELLDHLRHEAMKLPESERLQLARELEESVADAGDTALHPDWRSEIERRVLALDAGTAVGKPAAEAIAQIRTRLTHR